MSEKEEKEHHPHHHYITHIRYLKKTINLLTIGLEVGFLILVGLMIFLFSTIDELNTAKEEIFSLNQELTAIQYQQVQTTPLTFIQDDQLHFTFTLQNQNEIKWSVPISQIDAQFDLGSKARSLLDTQSDLHNYYRSQSLEALNDCRAIYLDNCRGTTTQDGLDKLQVNEAAFTSTLNNYYKAGTHKTVNVRGRNVLDFSEYITPTVFDSLASELFIQTTTDEEFVEEVWAIVRDLTTYSSEITETPRYPLETLFIGGGDCEDTSILVASIIKAAKQSWTVNLVYIDINRPTDMKEPNHILVEVIAEDSTYLIETTGQYKFNPFSEVDGVRVTV